MNISTLGEFGELDITTVSIEQMINRINNFIDNFSETAPAAKIKIQLATADISNLDSIQSIYEQIIDLY